jgi:tartrate-resistant acid phosphatase type 5
VARHFERFVHLVDVAPESALIGWGGFLLEERSSGWVVVDDDELGSRREGGTIGAGSAPYGPAVVEVLDDGGQVVARATTGERNAVEVQGLRPDTAYGYRVLVDGEPWAAGERWDWVLDEDGPGRPRPAGRGYDTRFRTHPSPDASVPLALLAFGDYGVGITNGEAGRRQAAVSRTLEHLAARHDVRALLSLGDNIYHGDEDRLEQSGDEDDDWYFTFYEPYRYLLDHLPLYPTAGNHDGADEEANDDRAQLADNFHLAARFGDEGPGLFYRVAIGALLELVCVDTSAADGRRHFNDAGRRAWLEEALPADGERGRPWRVPFCHHPAFCAGPHHTGMQEQVDELVPRYVRAGVPALLSGHEHNFQTGAARGITQVISGAAGKLQEDPPHAFAAAGTRAWAAAPHCLLVEVEAEEVRITPYGGVAPGQEPVPLEVRGPDGAPADPTVVVRR